MSYFGSPVRRRSIKQEIMEPVVRSSSGRTIKPSQKMRDAYSGSEWYVASRAGPSTPPHSLSPVKTPSSPVRSKLTLSTELVADEEQQADLKSEGPLEEGAKFECPRCDDVFPTHKLLAIHKRTHSRLYVCDVCHAEFKWPKGLEIHLQSHTLEETLLMGEGEQKPIGGHKPYRCNICDNTFRRKDYLIAHKQIHTGLKPHVCPFCDHPFRLRSSLIRHVRLHTGERPYQCEHCEETFTNKHVLNIHTANHTGARPFVCPHCGMSFIVATNLKRHIMIHSGERPYMCDECGERFIQQHHLTQHRRTHTGDTPYQCTVCETKFRFASGLDHHMKTSHQGVQVVKRKRMTSKQPSASSEVQDIINSLAIDTLGTWVS